MTGDRTILVTGVSSGIGWGLAHAWLNEGATVLGCSRRRPDDLLDQPGFHFETLDLRDESAVAPTLERLLAGRSHLHLALLNAGVLGPIQDLAVTPLSTLRELSDVNLWANKLVLDVLFERLETLDQVVTVSSGAAVNGNRGWGGYAISKAALNMLTRLYAAERPRTHFCAFAPGLVDTAMQDYLCGLPEDERYPSIDTIKSCQHTDDMPSPEGAAARLKAAIEQLPDLVESGAFTDVRQLELR